MNTAPQDLHILCSLAKHPSMLRGHFLFDPILLYLEFLLMSHLRSGWFWLIVTFINFLRLLLEGDEVYNY